MEFDELMRPGYPVCKFQKDRRMPDGTNDPLIVAVRIVPTAEIFAPI